MIRVSDCLKLAIAVGMEAEQISGRQQDIPQPQQKIVREFITTRDGFRVP